MKNTAKFYLRHNFLLKKELKKIEGYFENDRFEELKNQRFLELLESVKNNPFYKEFYKDVPLHNVNSIDDLHQLPVLTKALVRENASKILNKKTLTFKGYTSGTIGSPLEVHRDLDAIIKENAYVWWYRKMVGLHPKDKKISLRGDLDKRKLFQFEKVSNTLYISSYNLNAKSLPQIVEQIKAYQPKALLAYPSAAHILAGLLNDANLQIDIPLTFTSSERLLDFQKLAIENQFNTKIYDWYGTAERTIALYSAEDGNYYEPPLYSVNEYHDKYTLTTGLINTCFPLIRYQVNDVIETSGEYNFEKKSKVITEVLGRTEDYVLLPDGSKIGRLDMVFKGVKGVKTAQLIQKSVDFLQVNIVAEHISTEEKQEILEKLENRLGNSITLELSIISEEELIFTSSGKFKYLISEL